jgi:hypothetical protein
MQLVVKLLVLYDDVIFIRDSSGAQGLEFRAGENSNVYYKGEREKWIVSFER